MRDRMTMFGTLVLAAVLAGGCAKPAATAAPANAGGGAGASDGPAAAKFVCHLSCSGTEATGYGATEEAARDDVSQHIEQNCKPADGQYFVFCDPPK